MENSNDFLTQSSSPESPRLTNESAAFLLKAAKWGKFLAILGFIVTGLMLVGGILMGFILGALPEEMMPLNMPVSTRIFSFIYIIIAGIYIAPVIFLNSFCNNAIKSVQFSSTENLTIALRNLKNLFVFVGISTIVVLSFYVIILLVVGVAAVASL